MNEREITFISPHIVLLQQKHKRHPQQFKRQQRIRSLWNCLSQLTKITIIVRGANQQTNETSSLTVKKYYGKNNSISRNAIYWLGVSKKDNSESITKNFRSCIA